MHPPLALLKEDGGCSALTKICTSRISTSSAKDMGTLVKYLCTILNDSDPELAYGFYIDAITAASISGGAEDVIAAISPTTKLVYEPTSWQLIHVAVENRCLEAFLLVFAADSLPRCRLLEHRDSDNSNLLHLVAGMPPRSKLDPVGPAAFQMQRELQWYMGLEISLTPNSRILRNVDGKTPKEMFMEEHEPLRSQGEEWLKDTANYSSIMAAFIAAITFAAVIAFQRLGKWDPDFPRAVYNVCLLVFIAGEVLSFFTSAIALVMFLSILSSSFSVEEFLTSLPNRLAVGLVTLHVSLLCTMLSFCAGIFLVVHWYSKRVLGPVLVLGCLPVYALMHVHFPSMKLVMSNTYGSGNVLKRIKRNLTRRDEDCPFL